MQARALQIQLVPAMHPPTAKPRSGANKVIPTFIRNPLQTVIYANMMQMVN